MTSKCVRFKDDKVELFTEQKPKASPGNVVVRVTLRPVNPADILSFTDMAEIYFSAFKDRHVIGIEGIGYVDEVGKGVTKVKVGQRVVPAFFKKFYGEGSGSWQEYIEIPENDVFTLPDSISDEVACQSIVNPWTAYGLIRDQNVPKGEWLVQSAAGSQVGRLVIQLAKYYGIKTINIVRRDALIDELKALGADVVINSSKEDVVEKVKEVTGGKFAHGGLDPVAGQSTKMVAACVKNGGKVFVYGIMSGTDVTISYTDIGRVQFSWWVLPMVAPTPEKTHEVAAEIFKLLDEKIITHQPAIKRFSLERFDDAIKLTQKESLGGKVLLES